jgi:hypothetical protein
VQVQLEYGSTLWVYSAKRGPMSALGTVVYPHSHLCKSLKYRQLGCQRANSHQAGTVDSRVDHNEQGIKPETYQGYRKQVVWKTTEDLEWIRDPRSSVANAIDGIPRQALYMCSPLRLVQLWRGYLCYLSARDLVFSPCVRGGSRITFTILDFDTP